MSCYTIEMFQNYHLGTKAMFLTGQRSGLKQNGWSVTHSYVKFVIFLHRQNFWAQFSSHRKCHFLALSEIYYN